MDLTILPNPTKMCPEDTDYKEEMSKMTRKTNSTNFKMAVALEAAKEQETLLGAAAKHGVSPSLAAAWSELAEVVRHRSPIPSESLAFTVAPLWAYSASAIPLMYHSSGVSQLSV